VILGSHDFDRSPTGDGRLYLTFGVGVFEWVLRAHRVAGDHVFWRDLKRGKAKVRITGFCCDPEPVYRKAREVVRALDAGTYVGAKRMTIRAHAMNCRCAPRVGGQH